MSNEKPHSALTNYVKRQTNLSLKLRGVPVCVTEWEIGSDAEEFHPRTLWSVEWNDGVAQFECELYDSLAVALARVALLADCAEHDWYTGFVDDERWFPARWELFRLTALTESSYGKVGV